MMVPVTLNIIFRVTIKIHPDNATSLLKISAKNRFVSLFHKCDGIVRRNLIGFRDSSLMRATNKATANVRTMRKANEIQK